MIGQARLLLNTVRHLRAEQIYGRAVHRLSRPVPDLRPAPPVRAVKGDWAPPAPKPQSLIGPNRFRFLNHTADAPGWNSEELDKITPGVRDEIKAEKLAALSDIQRRAFLSTNEEQMKWKNSSPELMAFWEADSLMKIRDLEVANRAPESVRAKARRLAERIEDQLVLAERINRYRGHVNFDYWGMRAEAEQTKMVAKARTLLHTASEKLKEASPSSFPCRCCRRMNR